MRWIVAAVVVAAGVVVAVLVVQRPPSDSDAPAPIIIAEARVVTTDLVQTETFRGSLRYREVRTVRAGMSGIVTSLPSEGDEMDPGSVMFELDGLPVIVLRGDRPAWRPLVEGMDVGPDVFQLETNLVELGHLEVADDVFDHDTAEAVEVWRDQMGLPEGSFVELGRVVFLPATVRVARSLAQVGQPASPGMPVLEISGLDQEVLLELSPDDLDLVREGAAVIVTLPDGTALAGVVERVSSVVRPAGPEPGAAVVVDVSIWLADGPTGLDLAPVDVEIESARAVAVLAVPVRALLALSDGGYAVERRVGSSTELVGVEIGDFAGGLVEVRGPLAEGDIVLVPG